MVLEFVPLILLTNESVLLGGRENFFFIVVKYTKRRMNHSPFLSMQLSDVKYIHIVV